MVCSEILLCPGQGGHGLGGRIDDIGFRIVGFLNGNGSRARFVGVGIGRWKFRIQEDYFVHAVRRGTPKPIRGRRGVGSGM